MIMPKKSFVLYKGESRYDVHDIFVDQLSLALTSLGHDTFVVDFRVSNFEKQVKKAFSQERCDGIIAFNGICSEYTMDGLKHNPIDVPFFAYLVDHPIYSWLRLEARKNNLIVSCVDQSHVEFIKRYLFHHIAQLFLPHGGSKYSHISPSTHERPLDVVFFGFLLTPEEAKRKWWTYPPYVQQLIEKVIENLIINHPTSSDDMILCILQSMGYEDGKEINNLIPLLIHHAEEYMRNYLRLHCIKEIDRAGIAIDIYGGGWENEDFVNARVHPAVEFSQSLHIMQLAKIVLSTSPTLPHGSHERVFSSMLNGAVTVTDISSFYTDYFVSSKDLIYFRWQEIQKLADTIKSLISNPKKLRQISAQGQQKVLKNHTWLNRAKRIVEVFEETK